jgi:esterase
MKLFYRSMGSGKPLVILHGLLGMSDNWITIGKSLAEHYHVWIPDQRNHGRSPHHPVHTYRLLAEDLKAFLHEHSIGNPVVIGHSMGGKVAMQFASMYPIITESLVVVDIAPISYLERAGARGSEHRIILGAMSNMDMKSLKTRAEAEERLSQAIPSARIRQFILKNLNRNEHGEFTWLCDVPVLLDSLEEIMGSTGHTMPSGIASKTLFIRGALSDYILPEDEQMIHASFPAAEIKIVPGAGHWVHAEQPAAFLEAILDFLHPTS